MFREVTSPHKTVYVLDFQEIYSYIFPNDINSQDAAIVDYVLNNITDQFMLLQGTWYELLYKVRSMLGNIHRADAFVDAVEAKQTQPNILHTIREFLRSDREELFTQAGDFNKDLKSVGITLVEVLAEYETPFQRLAALLNKPNHISLEDLTAGYETIEFDQELTTNFHNAINELRKSKKKRQYSNYADAANLAGIVGIRQYMNQKSQDHTIAPSKLYNVHLLSHSETLFNINTWAVDYLGKTLGEQLTRTPIDVMYRILLQQGSVKKIRESINMRLKLVNEASAFVRDSIDNLLSVEEQQSGTIETVNQAWSNANDIQQLQLPDKFQATNLAPFINYVHDPILSAMDDVIQRNTLLTENKRQIGLITGESDITSLFKVSILQSEMRVLAHWNDIQNQFKLKLKDIRMKINHEHDGDDQRVHISLWKTNEAVFSFEKYAGYFSSYWPTAENLARFFEIVQLSVEYFQRDKNTSVGEVGNEAQLFALGQTQVHGKRLPIADLDVKALMNFGDQITPSDLKYLRIATIWGDFCYDIQPIQISLPLTMGFISRYNLVDTVCSLFFRSTSHHLLVPRLLKGNIEKYFQDYPSFTP